MDNQLKMNSVQIMILLHLCSNVWSAPTSMKTYTMYTEQQSWNAANMICTLRGGYLVKIESSSENSFLLEQLNDIWSGGNNSFYIGLHNAAMKSDTAEYFWTDCTPQYDILQPYDYLRYCVSLFKNTITDGWATVSCTDLMSFVCETDGGRCNYHGYAESEGTRGISYNATVMAQNECLFLCNEAMLNGMECWGVTYNFLTEICILHLSNDSTIFDNGGITSRIGSKFFKKQCWHVDVDNSVYPSGSSNNIPFTNCYSAPSTGSIYTIFERGVTWQEAKDVCSHIGASLLEYKSNQDVLGLLNVANPLLDGFSSIWIGLRRYSNLTFLWQDGTGITNSDLWTNQPSHISGTCVRANRFFMWLDDNCTNSHPFICEQPGVCAFEVLPDTKGDTGTAQGLTTTEGCMQICENNSTCIAFSHYLQTFFWCETHHNSNIYYYFSSDNYNNISLSTFYRYSCTHALLIGNMSVQIPNLYHPSGINLSENTFVSSSTLVEETISLIQNATSSVSELSEVSLETFSVTESIEATESSTETVSSTGVFPNTPALETTQFSDSTFQYTETIEHFTETLGYSTDSLDFLDPSSFDSYTDSAIQSLTLSETTTPSIVDISFSEYVTSDTSYLEVITTSGMSSYTKSVIGKTIEPSFTSVINGYGDESLLEANTSPQTATPSEFPTLYPPKQSKYIPVCPCRCVSRVISSETIGNRIQELLNDLTLNKRNLSRTLHSLYSMEDDRPSAQTIGYSSIILLLCLFSFFLIMDISNYMIHRSAVLVITK